MKYGKADKVLPKYIIELIQQYIDGGYLYIPIKSKNRKAWGENSGTKDLFKKRNKDLSAKYYLTEQSIRRIIRNEK